MAKRKRLTFPTEAEMAGLDTTAMSETWPGAAQGRPAPIAGIAGESAAQAALADLADEMERSRKGGRLVVSVPLEAVDETYLVRDRIAIDAEDLAVLKASLAERGQQTPLEVTEAGGGRYGLISGWRRLTALRQLLAETGEERFAEVLCLIRRPDERQDAYRAMVEENEIRAGIGFYERARICVRAAEEGAFSDPEKAIKTLFSAAPYARRSKIRSFVSVYQALDPVLRFAAVMPERLGLALAAALAADAGFAGRLARDLAAAAPADAAAERSLLEQALRPEPEPLPAGEAAGIRVTARGDRLILSGPGLDAGFRKDLETWLAGRQGG